MIKEHVKPSDFDIKRGLCGSDLGKSEMETIARNIIVISADHRDEWADFTFDDYCIRCGHEVTESERGVLNDLVLVGALALDGETYSVTDAFIAKLRKFVTTEEAE